MRRGGEGRDSGVERGGMVRREGEWRMKEGIFYVGIEYQFTQIKHLELMQPTPS